MSLILTRLATLGFLLALFLITGCGDKDDPVGSGGGGGGGTLPDTVTYTSNMRSVFDTRCTTCHSTSRAGSARNGAPLDVNFNTYNLAQENGVLGNTRVQAGIMPPTGGLPSSERALFQQWVDQGLLE